MNIENNITELPKSSWSDVFKNILFLVLTIGFAYFLLVKFGINDIRGAIGGFGAQWPIVVVILKAMTIVVVPLGGTPIYPIAGALFGFWPALLYTALGDILGATIAFYLSRIFGRSILGYFMNKSQLPIVDKLINSVSKPKTFIKTRIFFAGFPELFAYASGLTKINYPIFIFAYMIVNIVGAGLLISFGDVLISGNLFLIAIIGVLTTAVAFIGIWWLHVDIKRSS